MIHADFANFLVREAGVDLNDYTMFTEKDFSSENVDFLFSFGGDGTFLETLKYVKKSGLPVLGINTGRLGFLANISRDEMISAIDDLCEGKYSLEDRSLMQIELSGSDVVNFKAALNEISVHKKDVAMITIVTELDGEYLNSYWADGLIISTPTGSTAYSMSVGGPIMLPESKSFIISPVSPHNLTVRPIVIPDNKEIKLSVKSRSNKFLVAIDSTSYEVSSAVDLVIRKAPYSLKMIKFEDNNFYNTLRNKLMWGMDKRN